MALPRRPLGRSGISVVPIALGGNVFGWTANEAESARVLEKFVSAGFNLIDTADVYSAWVGGHQGGESETIIGNWLRESGRRDDVVLATKAGMDMGPRGKGLSAEHVQRAAEASLRRLRTDRIDLYQAHVDDPSTPVSETLGAFDALVRSGRVRAIGASNYSAPRFQEFLRYSATHGIARFETLQPRYNLIDRTEFEGELQSVCRSEGVGVLAYTALASGFLTGKYRSEADLGQSPRGVRVASRLNDRGFRVLATLDAVAEQTHSTPTTVALAWLMARPGVTAPIASARTVEQLQPILDAVDLRLPADCVRLLDDAGA